VIQALHHWSRTGIADALRQVNRDPSIPESAPKPIPNFNHPVPVISMRPSTARVDYRRMRQLPVEEPHGIGIGSLTREWISPRHRKEPKTFHPAIAGGFVMPKSKLSNKKVLVTGAGGFIGSHLCEYALVQGATVRAFVHYNSRNDWGMLEDVDRRFLKVMEVIAGDLRDAHAVRRAVRGCDLVFHLGALIGIPYSYANPADVVSTNILGTLNVLQAGVDAGIARLVQTSTSEVYGTALHAPMDEHHPLQPQSPYAASKVGADMLAASYYRTYGLPVVTVRPFNTYGPRQSLRAVIPTIIVQALASSTVRLGRLDPSRDLTYVGDTVRGFALAAAAQSSPGQTIHLGSSRETSVGELVEIVGSILGKRLKVRSESKRRRPDRSEVERLLASNRKAEELLSWRPEVPLRVGLERAIRWYQSRSGGFKHRLYHI
jgi:NAD dependent epimerase/dehydratase